jgi:PAS domain S-box-containing protein
MRISVNSDTESATADAQIKRLNRVLRAIRNINHLLITEKDRNRLLRGICKNLIETRGYYNAWIAVLDNDRKLISAENSGLDEQFQKIVRSMKQGQLTNCAHQALEQPRVVLTADPFSTCMDCPLSGQYSDRGAMTVRLAQDGKIYGILSVSIPKKLVPDDEERHLLEDLAADIAYGLHALELEEDQKRKEKSLREGEKRFRDLVENSLGGISITQNNQVVYQNREMEKLFGLLPRASALSGLDIIHPDDAEKVKKFLQKISSKHIRPSDIDFRFYGSGHKGDRHRMKWVYCRARIIEYKGAEAVLVNMMDMTPIKEMEQIIRIQDKMSSLGRVAAGIAHEIRNPLSGINIYLNTLEKVYDKQNQSEKTQQIINQIKSASRKIESVIKRVMDFSRPGEPKYSRININQPIDEAIELSAVSLRKSSIVLEKSLAENLPHCHADPHLIEEMVLNLITNAAEATKMVEGERKIGVSTQFKTNRITVCISDSGPGIHQDIREKILDPFFTTKHEGTGIGLSIVQRIVTDHGGMLNIAGSQWGGAEFQIEIPTRGNSR